MVTSAVGSYTPSTVELVCASFFVLAAALKLSRAWRTRAASTLRHLSEGATPWSRALARTANLGSALTAAMGLFVLVSRFVHGPGAFADVVRLTVLSLVFLLLVLYGMSNLFNWPRWLVPPEYREQRGIVEDAVDRLMRSRYR